MRKSLRDGGAELSLVSSRVSKEPVLVRVGDLRVSEVC
jgi:hypothetical protein